MSLLDDLKAAGKALDIQFQPSSNEVQSVVGAVVHYLEHGDEFLKAAESGTEDLSKLLAPPPASESTGEPAGAAENPASAAPAEPASAVSDAELEARISDLQAQLASRKATSQATVVEHKPGAGATVTPIGPGPTGPPVT